MASRQRCIRPAWAALTAAAFAAMSLAVVAPVLAEDPISVTTITPSLDRQVIPRNVAAGSAGAVWYTTERYTPHAVGRVVDGKVSEFAIPCDGCDSATNITYIEDIVEGGDGSAYFPYTEVRSDGSPLNGGDNNFIGILTPSAGGFSFRKIKVPTRDAFKRFFNPTGFASITATPNGVCFSENAASRIGCLDAKSGALVEFSLPASSYPSGITYAYGSVWSVMAGSGKIVQLEPALPAAATASTISIASSHTTGSEADLQLPFDSRARLTLFDAPASAQPPSTFLLDIAASPDGSLVISDAGKKAIHTWSPYTHQLLGTMTLSEGEPLRLAPLPADPPVPVTAVATNPRAGGMTARMRAYSQLDADLQRHYKPSSGFTPFDVAFVRRGDAAEWWISGTDAEFKDLPIIVMRATKAPSNCGNVGARWEYGGRDDTRTLFAVQKIPVNASIGGRGGVPIYTMRIAKLSLPPGVQMDQFGILTGAPAAPAGTMQPFDFYVEVTDLNGCVGGDWLAIFVYPDCESATPLVLPPDRVAEKSARYEEALRIVGQGPYSELSVAGLPLGLGAKVDQKSDAVILSGTVQPGERAGDYRISITLKDANGCTATSIVRLKVIEATTPPPARIRPFRPS